jgi:hypothetical protein
MLMSVHRCLAPALLLLLAAHPCLGAEKNSPDPQPAPKAAVKAEAGPRFLLHGDWAISALPGLGAEKPSYWTQKTGDSAVWYPAFHDSVWTKIAVYRLVHTEGNDPAVKVEIGHAGTTSTVTLDCTQGKTGWQEIGTFQFSGAPDECVKLTRVSGAGTSTRVAAARFDILSGDKNSGIIQSVTLDDPVNPNEANVQLVDKVPWEVKAGPTHPEKWEMTFADEFDGKGLDKAKWDIESGSPGHILSSRWPENVVVDNGLLRLLAKKEKRGGKEWTTGNIWTKTFRQQYGYYECRMRIAKASGLNNAFWLMTTNKPTDPIHFEIDITESHYPNRDTMTLHQWAGKHQATGKVFKTPVDLSNDFHLYALEWNEKELIWFFDGKEVRRAPNTFCFDVSPVRVSFAVGRWAGRITDAIDGTSQDVDYVRVWQLKGIEPPKPGKPTN